MAEKIARGISKVINQLHGIDKQQPLQEGKDYTTGNGEEIKKNNFEQKAPVKKKPPKQVIDKLLAEGKLDEVMILVDRDIDALSKEQQKKFYDFNKLEVELTLQKMAMKVASQPGYKEFMSSPIMSSMMKPKEEKQEAKQTQETQSLFDALNTSVTSKPKKETQKTNTTKDPERTKITPGRIERLKFNESEADVLASTFNFMQKQSKWYKQKEKDDKKYRTKLDKQKDKFLDETIEALTGRKISKMRKMARATRKSGFLKYGLMAAAGIGGLLVAKNSLANVNWGQKFNDEFKDFKFPNFEDDTKDAGSNTGTSNTPNVPTTEGTKAIGGTKAGNWKKDMEFMDKVNKFADEKKIKASDLLAVMASESGFDPTAKNPTSGAMGLIQFTPKTAKFLGTSTEDLSKMSRSEQFEYVKKFFEKSGGLKEGANAGDIYAQIYLPSKKNDNILSKKGEDYYEGNKEFDIGGKGYITKEDLQQRAEKKKKEFYIENVKTTKIATNTNIPLNESTGEVQIKKIAGGSGIESYGEMKPEAIIFHHTGGGKNASLQSAINTMRAKIHQGEQYATQYIIDKDGSIYQLQSDTAVTYHAGTTPGKSKFTNWNSIGVEVVAGTSEEFTPAQLQAGYKLGNYLAKKHNIPYKNILGHGEISNNKMATEGKPIAELFREKKLSAIDLEYPDMQGMSYSKVASKTTIINNTNTNIGGQTTYLTSAKDRSNHSSFIDSQFNYVNYT